MRFVTVTSSNVDSIAWSDKKLYVKFLSGDLYVYEGVSHQRFEALLRAPSVGKYINENIKKSFPAKKIDPKSIL